MRSGLLWFTVLLAPSVSAQPAASAALPSRAAPSDSLLEVVLALLLVIGVILLLGWLVKRLQGGAALGGKGMKVVSVLPLSPREKAVLVEVGGEQLLLGVAPGRVNLLQRFEQPVVTRDVPVSGEFRERLQQALRRESR